jgi:Uma2 family endonuclease
MAAERIGHGEDDDEEPDVVLTCGEHLPADRIDVPHPVVIVEVLSPGTRALDTAAKLMCCMELPSLAHHLVLDPASRRLVHHRRRDATGFDERLVTAPTLVLDPPGLALDIAACFGD